MSASLSLADGGGEEARSTRGQRLEQPAGHDRRKGRDGGGRDPDLGRQHIEAGPLRHGDDHVLLEARVTGTQRVEWLGIPATGRCMDTRMIALYEFEGDQLVCERVYMDMAQIREQLEGLITVR